MSKAKSARGMTDDPDRRDQAKKVIARIALDLRPQFITERPELDEPLDGEEELVYATDPEPAGEERTENVIPRPEGSGQTTLEEWSF